jgi:hypothetical protein
MKNTGKYKVFTAIRAICFYKAPFFILYLLTLAFVIAIFKLPDEESLHLLNISFPVVGILAGISFSWAQCLPAGVHKVKALLASKLFFHSLILLCLAIMAKYISFANIPGMAIPRPVIVIMEILGYYAIGSALLFFYAGLHATGRNLWSNNTDQ